MCFIAERRAFIKASSLAAFAFAIIALCGVTHPNKAYAGEALYSAIIVDIAPIKATGLGDFANPIGAAVKRSLNRIYSGALDPRNKSLPILVVEVETIYYGEEQEQFSSGFFRHFTETRDQMSGTAIVRKGKSELKHVSILGTSSRSGSWPLIDDEKSGRLDAIAMQFAVAVRDELGN